LKEVKLFEPVSAAAAPPTFTAQASHAVVLLTLLLFAGKRFKTWKDACAALEAAKDVKKTPSGE
jgi:hypothetical protein